MKKNHLFIPLLALMCACGSSETNENTTDTSSVKTETKETTSQNDSNNLISCDGIGKVKFNLSEDKLMEVVGKENIGEDSTFAEGEFQGMEMVLFKGKPEEIRVAWYEEAGKPKTILALTVNNAQSVYKLANGIKVGSSLDELNKANGKPFKFSGFGWDYGGGIFPIEEGKLKDEVPCFSGLLESGTYPENNEDETNKVMGDITVTSDVPILAKMDVKLSSIMIRNEALKF